MLNPLRALLLVSFLLAVGTPGPAAAQSGKPTVISPAARTQPAPSAPLAALFEAYWEEQATLYPLEATAQGDNRYNDQLPN